MDTLVNTYCEKLLAFKNVLIGLATAISVISQQLSVENNLFLPIIEMNYNTLCKKRPS